MKYYNSFTQGYSDGKKRKNEKCIEGICIIEGAVQGLEGQRQLGDVSNGGMTALGEEVA